MVSKEIIAYETPPPAPMAIFEERVIHPDNQARLDALAARLERFKPLSKSKLFNLKLKLYWLHFWLNRFGVFSRVKLAVAKREELSALHTAYQATKNEAAALREINAPITPELYYRGRAQKAEAEQLQRQLAEIELRIEPHEKRYAEYVRIHDRISEHIQVVTRLAEEAKNRKQFMREGKLIAKALKETFLMTEGCHIVRYTKGGKTKKIAPRFQEIYLNSMVHSFVLLTSKKTLFGWKNKLHVNIERLVDPKTTLKNASAILHRQVWVDWDRTGSLPIFKVNRLDIRDGLPERVLFSGIIDIYPVQEHDLIPIPLGLGENFRANWANFETTPHILIAGATRSGKSNFVNSLICTMLYMQSPDEVRIIAIDNKQGVEFNRYKNVPHLADTISDTGDKVLPTLKAAIGVMTNRLKALNAVNAKNIRAFNAAVGADQRMPRLLIFVDEMATLLNREDTDDIHYALTVLTAQGAAAGVHVILATQYPNADTIPMSIKGNCDLIVGFRMPNFHASNMLFNSDEAFRLEKQKGRAYVSDAGERYKTQTPYISDSEVDRAIRFAIDQYKHKPFVELDTLEDTSNVMTLPMLEDEAPAPAATPVKFGMDDLLYIVIHEFNGVLNRSAIFDLIKSQGVTTKRELMAIVDKLKAQKSIEFEGVTYHVVRGKGSSWKLISSDEMLVRPSVQAESVSV